MHLALRLVRVGSGVVSAGYRRPSERRQWQAQEHPIPRQRTCASVRSGSSPTPGRGTSQLQDVSTSVIVRRRTDLDPVRGVVAGQQRLEIVATAVGHRAVVELGGQTLEQTDGDVALLPREGLAQEAPRDLDALRICAKVLDAVARQLADPVETLARGDVPVATLLDLDGQRRVRWCRRTSVKIQGLTRAPRAIMID